MERTAVAIEEVGNLRAGGKRLLEGILGQPLRDDQQVFIMVLSPGSEPDAAAREQARAGLEATFRRTEAYAERFGVTDQEIDAAILEAMKHAGRPKE